MKIPFFSMQAAAIAVVSVRKFDEGDHFWRVFVIVTG
jgi:hypothetical protein